MKQNIHTKFHKLIGARVLMNIRNRALTVSELNHSVDIDNVNRIITELSDLPRYVIYEDLLEMLLDPEGAMQRSLNLMIEHDLVRLPFESVIVEFDSPADLSYQDGFKRVGKVRHFVWLTEFTQKETKQWGERFGAVQWTLIEGMNDPKDCDLVLSPLAVACTLMSTKQMDKTKGDGIEVLGDPNGGAGVMMRAVPSNFFRKDRLTDKFIDYILDGKEIDTLKPVSEALCALIVLMHTKGVVQERITVDRKLNKVREKNDRPPIQDHTVIRIGHVYNRAGDKVEYRGTGKNMPVHWRSGHWRNQRWGANWEKERPVWIKPMLINYVEGEEPKHKTKEVTV